MAMIHILSTDTINRIAAGEVVERPVNVVKELTENAIDAGATAITVEIRNGGIDLIRVTDNGSGIEESQIRNAFRRHATSKIRDERDLSRLSTLGFRGEALSSIAAVSQVEMLTRTHDSLIGARATNVTGIPGHRADDGPANGGPSDGRLGASQPSKQSELLANPQADQVPLEITEVGAPEGTTVLVRNLFYNVPVRRKFLKTAQTEAGYITDLMQQLALSHPDISFRYRVNSQDKLQTSGNGNEKELIYRIFGREMADSVIPINISQERNPFKSDVDTSLLNGNSSTAYKLEGYLGRPEFSRASRNAEIFFVNDRILRSDVLSKGLEEGYRTDLMQHRFPFAILHLTLPPEEIDVNVHPSKMEVRFTRPKEVYDFLNEGVHSVLHQIELIPHSSFGTQKEEEQTRKEEAAAREAALQAKPHTEQFETNQLAAEGESIPAPRLRTEDPGRVSSFSSSGNNTNTYNSYSTVGPAAAMVQEKQVSFGNKLIENQIRVSQEEAQDHVRKDAEEAEDFIFDDRLPAMESAEGALSSADSDVRMEKPYGAEPTGPDESQRRGVFSVGGKGSLEQAEPASPDGSQKKGAFTAGVKGRYEQAELFARDEIGGTGKNASAGQKSDLLSAAADQTEEEPSSAAEAGDKAAEARLTEHVLSKEHVKEWRIIGQVFKTYWIIEYRDKMLLIDQHAAHEKVNFERLMARLSREQTEAAASQLLAPPIVVSLTGKEEAAYLQYADVFRKMGYEIEPFGGSSYALRAVPLELYANEPDALLKEVLDEILDEKMSGTPAAILYKIASMSCKAAVKGNTVLSFSEAEALIGELLSLDNPYHCPHGRPTMVILTQRDLEQKFKRIV